MASKVLVVLLALAAIVSQTQGQAASVIWLDDVTVTHISSAWHPKTIGIGHLWFDKLVSCNVIFPNGVMYEVYPTNRLNVPTVSYVTGSAFDPGCSIAFSNSPPSMSGTYEIMSQVEHQEDGTQTLTRQKTHITFVMSEVVFPTADQKTVKADA